jgi:hypothetical protein
MIPARCVIAGRSGNESPQSNAIGEVFFFAAATHLIQLPCPEPGPED